MTAIKIEVNGLDITTLAEKLDTLANVLTEKEAKAETSADQPEKFLTRIEVAKLLKITLPTLHDWTKKGLLKAYRIGNRIRYKETEVIETINNNPTNQFKIKLK